MMRFLLTLWLLVSIPVLVGCAVGIRAEGCEILVVELEGIMDGDALPAVKPP